MAYRDKSVRPRFVYEKVLKGHIEAVMRMLKAGVKIQDK